MFEEESLREEEEEEAGDRELGREEEEALRPKLGRLDCDKMGSLCRFLFSMLFKFFFWSRAICSARLFLGSDMAYSLEGFRV